MSIIELLEKKNGNRLKCPPKLYFIAVCSRVHAYIQVGLPTHRCPKELGKGAFHQKRQSIGCQPTGPSLRFHILRTQLTLVQLLHFVLSILWLLVCELRIGTEEFVASKIASNIEIVGITRKIPSHHTKEKHPRAVQGWGLKACHLTWKMLIIWPNQGLSFTHPTQQVFLRNKVSSPSARKALWIVPITTFVDCPRAVLDFSRADSEH